jgi:hypothetical protein
MRSEPVLVTDATGYLGGRLVPQLLAEMKFPGEATLEFRLHPLKDGGTELQQLSRNLARGLSRLAYWYVLYPFHQYIFKGMLKGIAKQWADLIFQGPDRFAPRLPHICNFDPRSP